MKVPLVIQGNFCYFDTLKKHIMKIEITRTIREVIEIEVDIPYYYKHEIREDNYESITYGCIENNQCIAIEEYVRYHDDHTHYTMECEKYSSIKNSGLASYFEPKHKSTQQEFEDARKRMLEFINTK